MLKVVITNDAKEFIAKKTDEITVRMEMCGGWSGVSFEPAVYAGAPQNTEDYSNAEANGLKVYVPKDAVIAEEGLEIDMVGQSFWKRLAVNGLQS